MMVAEILEVNQPTRLVIVKKNKKNLYTQSRFEIRAGHCRELEFRLH